MWKFASVLGSWLFAILALTGASGPQYLSWGHVPGLPGHMGVKTETLASDFWRGSWQVCLHPLQA